ncbi:hypothetical protein [Testudinibacter sp. TR-2022]|uniref:hypothetical protein n=1 Tax=Testudinibacter sp. TR-2022 TaxID=2585029 RepID=UPI00111A84AE|nr:hypothetical protein [Testudinibacter sp. TR-2022]TNH02974.1 hypothetical protein FHQ30_13005 [Pasteurellaceae bacterium Phil11]TNH22372.1 hypothetical protein FHQ29_07580 [Testudinibacter sp. TR-2022]
MGIANQKMVMMAVQHQEAMRLMRPMLKKETVKLLQMVEMHRYHQKKILLLPKVEIVQQRAVRTKIWIWIWIILLQRVKKLKQ